MGVRGSDRGRASGVDASVTRAMGDGDFQHMCVHRFLREAGEGTIIGRVYDGNYDQLVGHLRGRLDQ